MRAATQLALVLMGGGALTGGVAASMESGRACREARAAHDPRAETICRRHGGFVHAWHSGSGGWFGSGRWGTASGAAGAPTAGARAVSRGGFGLFGLHFSRFHG
jgi:hypothetical protein